MVHDEKVTVPLLMETPPPCKHKRKTCENPIGAMGYFQDSVARADCIDRSVVRSCASENQSERVSIFPTGAMRNFERESTHISSCVVSDGAR